MMLPARDTSEEEPSRTATEDEPSGTASDEAAGTPAGTPSQQDTQQPTVVARPTGTGEAMNTDRRAEAAESDADADVVVTTADAGVVADHAAAASASPSDSGIPAGADPPADTRAGQGWADILAMFVDDPRGSVAEASDMVNEAVEEFITTARERQASLAASWQVRDADTERLRVALQDYRAFWSSLTRLQRPA